MLRVYGKSPAAVRRSVALQGRASATTSDRMVVDAVLRPLVAVETGGLEGRVHTSCPPTVSVRMCMRW